MNGAAVEENHLRICSGLNAFPSAHHRDKLKDEIQYEITLQRKIRDSLSKRTKRRRANFGTVK